MGHDCYSTTESVEDHAQRLSAKMRSCDPVEMNQDLLAKSFLLLLEGGCVSNSSVNNDYVLIHFMIILLVLHLFVTVEEWISIPCLSRLLGTRHQQQKIEAILSLSLCKHHGRGQSVLLTVEPR